MHSTPKIKTMILYDLDGTSQTSHFEYDQKGRIIKKTYAPDGVETYRYLSDSLIVKQTHENEVLIHIDSLWLNDQGLAITHKSKEYSAGGLGFTHTFTSTYEYNAEGYRIKSSQGPIDYEIQDGNTVKLTLYSSPRGSFTQWQQQDSTDTLVIDFTYTFEYLPNSFHTIGNENMGITFMGKQNKNLVASIVTVNQFRPEQLSNRHSFTYQLDARKRVVKEFGTNARLLAEFTYY